MGSDGNMVPCKRGERVKHGAHIRLQHLETGKWLHSHSHRSPLSNNYEVSAFGKTDESNSNDNWVVDAQGADFWQRGSKARDPPVHREHRRLPDSFRCCRRFPVLPKQAPPLSFAPQPTDNHHINAFPLGAFFQVKFQHADTGVYLWSHNKPFPRPIQGQLEICGVGRKAPEADWIAAEGIYFYSDDDAEEADAGEL